MKTHRMKSSNGGFTLIELLVVACIIVLLMSVILSSLKETRKSARTTECASHLRKLCVGMAAYAADYDNAIVGSPINSGGYMFYTDDGDSPDSACMQIWDYIGPIRRVLTSQVHLPTASTLTREPRLARMFNEYRTRRVTHWVQKVFHCPRNNYAACAYRPGGGYDAGCDRMISYNTSRNFMWLGASTESPHEGSIHWPEGHSGCGYGRVPPYLLAQPPADYFPAVERVGVPSTKVFIADGARFNTPVTEPDYDIGPFALYGGAFADEAPYTYYSRSWNRWASPGARPRPWQLFLLARGWIDCRLYAYRHGNRTPGEADFRMNVAFFDGHVAEMSDGESANPHLWIPKGGTLERDSNIFDDVIEKYFGAETIIDIK